VNTIDKIKQLISQELGRNVEAETTMEELGLDSLEFVALMQAVSKETGDIPESRWEEVKTVGDLERLVEEYAHVPN
jgi:acyl carrier protein